MKDSVQIAVFFMLQHLSFVIGIVTIDFSSIGYIDQSIVLQCKDTDNITVSRANWYQGGTLLDLSSSRYNQTTLPDGFSLKISSLRSTDGGVYHCGIEFGTSSTKTLTIYYNTVEKDVKVEGNIITTTIAITIIAFPDPVYNINVTQDGNLTYVNWNVTKTTKTNGAIEVLLQNSTAFQDKIYTVVVTITSPVNLVVTSNISFVQTTPAPTSSCTTTPTTTTVNSTSSSSTSTSSATTTTTTLSSTIGNATISITSPNSTITGSTATTTVTSAYSSSISTSSATTTTRPSSTTTNTTNSSTSTNPTTTGSTANDTSITSTSTNLSTTVPNATAKRQDGVDINVIVPAVVVPIGGLLLIGAIILVVVLCKRRHRAGKNVREIPDGIAAEDEGNNVDEWKQSLGHGRTADKLDGVYTTPDGFIIYPGPAAMSTARPLKEKKHHDVADQYSRPYTGTYGYQAAHVPNTYTSARPYTHKDRKHDVTDQYNRPYTGTYGYQATYVPSNFTSAKAYTHKGRNHDYVEPIHQQASHRMAARRPAYDQTPYYPQTGYYGQTGEDVYYRGGGQYLYGQRSRSHHDHSRRQQQQEYYNQYEMANYGGSRAGYGQTKRHGQDTAFYY